MVRTGDREQRSRRALPGLAASKGLRGSAFVRALCKALFVPVLGVVLTMTEADTAFSAGPTT